jgi:hypothetical protein
MSILIYFQYVLLANPVCTMNDAEGRHSLNDDMGPIARIVLTCIQVSASMQTQQRWDAAAKPRKKIAEYFWSRRLTSQGTAAGIAVSSFNPERPPGM